MDKTIRRVTDREAQQRETWRYWQSRSLGERLIAVRELSESAYAFAGAFKGATAHAGQRSERYSASIQGKRG